MPTVDLPSLDDLRALQDAVKSAQTSLSTAMTEASSALDAQTAACAVAYGNSSQAEPDSTLDHACDTALAYVQQAQQAVSDRQATLSEAIDNLTTALVTALERTSQGVTVLQDWMAGQNSSGAADDTPAATASNAVSSTELTVSPALFVTSTATVTTVATDSGSGTSTQGLAAASALSVARAQANIDTAAAALVKAQEQEAATTIVARGSGTVAAVNVAVGDAVSSGEVVATVTGTGGATVQLSLTSTEIRAVAVGQSAMVNLPGVTESVAGQVTWVSPVASAGSTSIPAFARSNTYAAQVQVSAEALGDRALPQGARAEVSVTVGTVDASVSVPTSAVIPGTQGAAVRVLTADGLQTRSVETGLMGASRTEITSGLDAGAVVVLADLDAAVDAAGEVQTSTGFPGGSFPGGGFPGGGNTGGRGSGGGFSGAGGGGLPRR